MINGDELPLERCPHCSVAKPRIVRKPVSAEAQRDARVRGFQWKEFRRLALLSQSELAQALSISKRTIVQVENARILHPRPATLRAFRDLERQHLRDEAKAKALRPALTWAEPAVRTATRTAAAR